MKALRANIHSRITHTQIMLAHARALGASIASLQDDQDGYLRELDASDILAMHGESSGHVYLYGVHKLI